MNAIDVLSFDEIDMVGGAGEVGDAIRAAGEVVKKISDAAYDAGYRLGKSIHDLFS